VNDDTIAGDGARQACLYAGEANGDFAFVAVKLFTAVSTIAMTITRRTNLGDFWWDVEVVVGDIEERELVDGEVGRDASA